MIQDQASSWATGGQGRAGFMLRVGKDTHRHMHKHMGTHMGIHTKTRHIQTQVHRNTGIYIGTQRPDLTYPEGHIGMTHSYTPTSHTCKHAHTHSHPALCSTAGAAVAPVQGPQRPGSLSLLGPGTLRVGRALSPSQHPAPH